MHRLETAGEGAYRPALPVPPPPTVDRGRPVPPPAITGGGRAAAVDDTAELALVGR